MASSSRVLFPKYRVEGRGGGMEKGQGGEGKGEERRKRDRYLVLSLFLIRTPILPD